jgi:antitoxin HicB
MKSLEEYKKLDYKMVVQYDSKEKCFFVDFPELPGCMADGDTAAEAVEKALRVRDEWLEVALNSGYKIPEPTERVETTGRQTTRMPKSLHARLIERAEEEGVSQNQLILSYISEGLARAETGQATKEVLTQAHGLAGVLADMIRDVSGMATIQKAIAAQSWREYEVLEATALTGQSANRLGFEANVASVVCSTFATGTSITFTNASENTASGIRGGYAVADLSEYREVTRKGRPTPATVTAGPEQENFEGGLRS